MSYSGRLLFFVVVSFGCHLMLARGMRSVSVQQRPRGERPAVVNVQLRARTAEPPPPPPQREFQPEVPTVSARNAHAPRRSLPRAARAAPRSGRIAVYVPTERPATDADPGATPVYGVSMESTSRGGTGPVVPVGNTLQVPPGARRAGPAPKPLPPPVSAHQVTKLPLPQGRCSGRYTEEARQAGLEGTVVLDLIVGEDGRVREVKVVQGLGGGLSEAAVAALKGCHFTPGERDGRPVPVRLRGFKIRFFLQGGD